MSARVTVVVRSRGVSRDLARAVASVRAQTFSDWALVLVVPDGVEPSAAERLADGDERVVVIRADGRGVMANSALAATDSDMVVLHDDDGTWQPVFLARAVAFLDEHPDHVAVASRAEVVHPAGADDTSVREVLAGHEPMVSLTSLLVHNYVPPVSLMFRRSAAEAVGRYDEELPALEDWEFLLRLVEHGPVGFLPGLPLAAWYAGPPGDLDEQRAAELVVRDRVLRHDLTGKGPGPMGLGVLLAFSDQLSAVADRWGRAHQSHLDVVTTDQRIELGRMRGEMLLMREVLTELQEDIAVLGIQVEKAVARTGRPGDPPRGKAAMRDRAGLARRAVRRLARRSR